MKYLIIFFVIFLTIAILLFFNYMLKNSDKINKLYNINNIEKFSSICEKKSNNEKGGGAGPGGWGVGVGVGVLHTATSGGRSL